MKHNSINGVKYFFALMAVFLYPVDNGIIEIIPWENGNTDKNNIQRFLPALLKDGESETISLKPGESIVGHYSASKKTFSDTFES